jgi:hypothetical protein
VGPPDWQNIRRIAYDISTATVGLRQSLIKDMFDIGAVTPMKSQCDSLCQELNQILDLPTGDIEGEMITTVSNALDATLDLQARVALLIETAGKLRGKTSVPDRAALEEEWTKRRKKAMSVSRTSAGMLDALVEVIDLLDGEDQSDAGTGEVG